MNCIHKLIFTLAILLLGISGVQAQESVSNGKGHDFRFEAGFGSRNQMPITLIGSVGYKNAILRFQGFGLHEAPNDFWVGVRGSVLWTFFRGLPFNFDVGVGGGYEYAEAPNKMHQALNDANKAKYLLPYNFKEQLDISLEIWAHIYGFYTQIGVPAYQFKNHDADHVLWGVGYIVSF